MQQTPHAPAPRKMEWKRAWPALQKLIEDPERTDQVFEIVRALAGNSFERSYQRFCAHSEGRRLLQERPSLLAVLSDREQLRRMPDGSFGRVYLAFMEDAQLDAQGLVEAEAMATPNPEPADPDREWFGDRIRDMHDLWHVLTGYGRDEAGEAANLAFTQGQIPNPGVVLILLAAIALGPKDLTLSWPRYLYHAWRRGRRAALLTTVRYEDLLSLPLKEVRTRLQIQPASHAHPGGIIVSNRGDAEPVALPRDSSAGDEVYDFRRAS